MEEQRKIEIFEKGSWREISFNLLLKGDKFRMFEPTGEAVVGSSGDTEFIAAKDTYVNKHGEDEIDIED